MKADVKNKRRPATIGAHDNGRQEVKKEFHGKIGLEHQKSVSEKGLERVESGKLDKESS